MKGLLYSTVAICAIALFACQSIAVGDQPPQTGPSTEEPFPSAQGAVQRVPSRTGQPAGSGLVLELGPLPARFTAGSEWAALLKYYYRETA